MLSQHRLPHLRDALGFLLVRSQLPVWYIWADGAGGSKRQRNQSEKDDNQNKQTHSWGSCGVALWSAQTKDQKVALFRTFILCSENTFYVRCSSYFCVKLKQSLWQSIKSLSALHLVVSQLSCLKVRQTHSLSITAKTQPRQILGVNIFHFAFNDSVFIHMCWTLQQISYYKSALHQEICHAFLLVL